MSEPDWDTAAEQEIESRIDEYCTRTYVYEPCADPGCPVHGGSYDEVPAG